MKTCTFGTLLGRCECRKAMHADTYLRTMGEIMQATYDSEDLRKLALGNLEKIRGKSKCVPVASYR